MHMAPAPVEFSAPPADARLPRGRGAALRRAALVVAAALASVSSSPADPVRMQDLELLLQGGVGDGAILRHVRRWGLERDLAAADLVALKRAGASDSLLEILAGERGGSEPEERVASLPGGGVLFTNLDEQGRRIGGEAPEPAPVNRVEIAESRAPRAGSSSEPEERAENLPAGSETFPPERARSYGLPDLRRDLDFDFMWGTPGGYSRFKTYYSRAPHDGFRTWVPPVVWLARVPVLIPPVWGGALAPLPVFAY